MNFRLMNSSILNFYYSCLIRLDVCDNYPTKHVTCYLGGLDRAAILSELSGFGFRSVSESRISLKHESLDHLPWAPGPFSKPIWWIFFGTLESFFYLGKVSSTQLIQVEDVSS